MFAPFPKLFSIALFLVSSQGFAADLTHVRLSLFTEYGARVTELRINPGESQMFKITLPKSYFAAKTTYEVHATLSNTYKASYLVQETIEKDDGSKAVKTEKGALANGKSWGLSASHLFSRSLFNLVLVENERMDRFFSSQSVYSYETPVKGDDNKWDHTIADCPDAGGSDAFSCPLFWTVKYSTELNLKSLLIYAENDDPFPVEKKLNFTSHHAAFATITHRFETQLNRLQNESGQDMTEYRRKFNEKIKGLLNQSQLVSCRDTYWAPSVNSTTCYFIDLISNQVTRVEHGDTDG